MTQNTSYITNPGYTSAYTTAGSCIFSVTPLSTDICQLRLDFVAFDLAEDTSTGACTDSFAVSVGSGRTYHVLCGTATGQHIYLETGRSTSAQTLTFTIASSGTWKAKIIQLECYAPYKAPSDCYQYYTGLTGRVSSFNFGSSRVQIQTLRYTACIRQEYGYCGIEWTPTQGLTTDSWLVSNDAINVAGGAAAAAENAYVAIPGSRDDSYSGGIFAYYNAIGQTSDATIMASGERFLLEVYSIAATQTSTTGFDLTWSQVPCATSNLGTY